MFLEIGLEEGRGKGGAASEQAYYFLQAYSIHELFFCLSFFQTNLILVKCVGLVYYEANLGPLFVTML